MEANHPLIDLIAERLFASEALSQLQKKLLSGQDATMAAPLSARPLVVASAFRQLAKPMLVLLSGEEAAAQFQRELALWLGPDCVQQLPLYTHQPWREQALTSEELRQTGKRARALELLSSGRPQIVVASARALLRRLPASALHQQSLELVSGRELGPDCRYAQLAQTLADWGYQYEEKVREPGQFSLRGDLLDIYPNDRRYALRVEFFGEEVDQIRRVVVTTGQTIDRLESVQIRPARELLVDAAAKARALRTIYGFKGDQLELLPADFRHHLELIEQDQDFPERELYLPYFYPQSSGPLDCLSQDAIVIAIEPRSLFDDATRYYDETRASLGRHIATPARAAQLLEGLFLAPGELDFGRQQRLTMLALIAGSSGMDLRLEVKHPAIRATPELLAGNAATLLKSNFFVAACISDHNQSSTLELALSDAHVSFTHGRVQPGTVYMADLALPTSLIFPQASLALLGLEDNSATSVAQRGRRRAAVRGRQSIDPTDLSFPYKPGDYVVHEVHGIAYFRQFIRQEVVGVERDYLQLEYAEGDKLFIPVEQIDRITRYIGPAGRAPRLTRLNTSDWARATGKARKAARQLAFDLVDLYARRAISKGHSYNPDNDMQFEMEQGFPYEETPDQLAAIADVKADMESDKPMDRLICGDVGFGKTEVALRAAFKAIQDGRQVMLLAPTTILAQQHYSTFFDRFDPFAVNVDVLSRFRSAGEQKRILERFADGSLDMLIGTHRLLSADVNPDRLGLIIIDEEQRFGVQHKEQLKNMREQVDVLTLSATPIPRTLQMAMSGVRDMSLINTPPVSRTPVQVRVGEWQEDLVSTAIRHELGRGGQVYYVSNRVRSIDDAVERVLATAPEARIGVAHGQMRAKQLEDIMERFAAGEYDVLVATTIIESGLDNPHTNTLIIEDSQRLGLAQLYQLKGRVGRAHAQAYAYFLFPSESQLTEDAIDRLTTIDEFQDLGSGMKVAMRDLEIRGAGSLLGAEQHGNLSAVGFELFVAMINEAVRAAQAGMAEDELKAANQEPELRIEIPLPCLLPEDYLPAVDERVLTYRRLMAAADLETVAALEKQLERNYGALPGPARDLVDRRRVSIMAMRLGITHISIQRKQLVLEGLRLSHEQARAYKQAGGLYFPKSLKLQYPIQEGLGYYAALLVLLDGLLKELEPGGEDAEDVEADEG